MAGHLALKKEDEKEVFKQVDTIRKVLNNIGDLSQIQKFKELEVTCKVKGKLKTFTVMPLPKEYTNHSVDHAFMIGSFDLAGLEDQHPSLTKGIKLEVHFREIQVSGRLLIRDIFLVA